MLCLSNNCCRIVVYLSLLNFSLYGCIWRRGGEGRWDDSKGGWRGLRFGIVVVSRSKFQSHPRKPCFIYPKRGVATRTRWPGPVLGRVARAWQKLWLSSTECGPLVLHAWHDSSMTEICMSTCTSDSSLINYAIILIYHLQLLLIIWSTLTSS